jgi:hypothetical protein
LNSSEKTAVLERIYAVYGDVADGLNLACKRGCDHCCTRNVTLTTLEGYHFVNLLEPSARADLIRRLEKASGGNRFRPRVTTNEISEICLRGEDPPEEELEAGWGSCPLLHESECPFYAVRPFGCRCMVSARNCGETGAADMDPFLVTLNTVILQYIEHVDADGYSGNLTDILLWMGREDNLQRYREGALPRPPEGLIPNRPVKALMVPPRHRAAIKPILEALGEVSPRRSGN